MTSIEPDHTIADLPDPRCACEDSVMLLMRSYPKLGGLRELRTYRCSDCGYVETVEVD